MLDKLSEHESYTWRFKLSKKMGVYETCVLAGCFGSLSRFHWELVVFGVSLSQTNLTPEVRWFKILHNFDLKLTKLAKFSSTQVPKTITAHDLRVFCVLWVIWGVANHQQELSNGILPKKEVLISKHQLCLNDLMNDLLDTHTHNLPFQSFKWHTGWKSS